MLSLIRLMRYLKKYRSFMLTSFFLLAISAVLNLVQPKLMELAIDYGISTKALNTIIVSSGGILIAGLISFISRFTSNYFLIKSSQGLAYDMRNTLYNKIMSFSFTNLDKWRTGELMVRMNADIRTIMMFVQMGFFIIIQSVIMIIGSLIIMFFTNAQLAIVMAIIMPSALILFFILAYFIRPLFIKVREKLDSLNNVLQENLAGAKVVRAFARQSFEKDRFDTKNKEYLKSSLKVGYIIALLFPVLFLIGQLALTATLWLGGIQVIENILKPAAGGLTLGQLVAFNNYALLSLFPIIMLGMVLSFISMAAASAARVEELLTENPSIIEKESAVILEKIKGKIEFKNVSFCYGEGEKVLNNISLKINPGEKIGIIGTTGAGKSSFAHLILRFYDPQEGNIFIDDINIKDLSLKTLRRRISLVLQDILLFSRTIKENIIFGQPDADDSKIEKAALASCAKDFILEKEKKWSESVGERGMGLSGGQRQRIAIARAILTIPDIIILDDVTSSVDLETENDLIENLYREFHNKTIILITQKINTIKKANRIIVFNNGKISGTGSHEHLLNSNIIYKEIFLTQNARIFT